MSLADEGEITAVWDAFADAGFRYVSSNGNIYELDTQDSKRREQLPVRRDILARFLDNELDIETFRSEMVSEAASNKLWGFSGTSGGMFLNMLISSADPDLDPGLETILRDVLVAPEDTDSALDRIKRLEDWVDRIRSGADDMRSAPSKGFIPYFLSYFWQLQDPNTYPIYYTSIRDALSDLGFWEPSGDLGQDYIEFWELNEAIRETLEDYTGDEIHLWKVERMFLFWNSRDQFEETSELTGAHQAILHQWKQAAHEYERAKHFNFHDKYSPEEARTRADEFVRSPSKETFGRLWDPMHGAQRAGAARAIYEKWQDEKDHSDQELAELINEIRSADAYDPTWETELGAKRTVWELFGLLHIEEFPIINGSAERGLVFFGYSRPNNYPATVEQFEAFKNEYERIVGHATAGTDHVVPLNLEIDQLLNVVDKVQDGDQSDEEHKSVAELYRLILDEKGSEPPVLDPPEGAGTIERQLTQAGQLVFHGPPGTGKTYTALRFARWWLNQTTTNPTEAQLEVITFHPSFTYEDFIEGLTAREREGAVEYSVESGVFKRFSDHAREAYEKDGDDAKPFVLIIDEINRGNLAQIFGETITLLEPDKRMGADNETATTLPHSKKRFKVPPNLYIIGTMNTADRSIALVDAALRRRFRFIGFPPKMKVLYDAHNFGGAAAVENAAESSPDPARQLLALSIKGLETLNEAILKAPNLGKGKQIGHSYLIGVDDGATVEQRLQSMVDAWQFEILPLLEEYYFGQFDRIKQDLFEGGGGRLFEWDTERIKTFDPDDLARTLITLTETSTEWTGVESASDDAGVTYQDLLDEGILRPGDGLVFNSEMVPTDATRHFDPGDAFWQCEVTGEPDQQDQVRWKQNQELYSVAGLSRTVLEEVTDSTHHTDGLEYWCHSEYDGHSLAELGTSNVAGNLDIPEMSTTGEADE